MNQLHPIRKAGLTLLAALLFGFLSASPLRAGVTINFDIGEITTAGTLVNIGTFLFISHGADNAFNSNSWLSGSTFILGDDALMGAFAISNGRVTSAFNNISIPAGSTNSITRFTGVFIAGMTASNVDYATGQLTGGNFFGSTGGTTYNFGTYRTDNIEGFGSGPVGNMAWIIPADGATLALNAASNTNLGGTGFYTGADFAAALGTSSTFTVIPEPSSMSLVIMGLASALALRRKNAFMNRKKHG